MPPNPRNSLSPNRNRRTALSSARRDDAEGKGLEKLGRQTRITAEDVVEPTRILESFANPYPRRDYEIEFVFPEFTSLCPVTGQPDFATIRIHYIPGARCVEMKSLKLYFFAFRNRGIFYEAVVNAILDDLVALLKPRQMTVIGQFAVRGGTAGTVTARHDGRARQAVKR